MSKVEENPEDNVEDLKAKISELEAQLAEKNERLAKLDAENEKLRKAIGEAGDTLKAYVDREKDTVIKSLLEKTNWSRDELEKLDLPQLKLVQKAIDSVRGTVKNIRSAGAVNSEDENKLTVGCLYHKE